MPIHTRLTYYRGNPKDKYAVDNFTRDWII